MARDVEKKSETPKKKGKCIGFIAKPKRFRDQ
jgi:hypothetical protein